MTIENVAESGEPERRGPGADLLILHVKFAKNRPSLAQQPELNSSVRIRWPALTIRTHNLPVGP